MVISGNHTGYGKLLKMIATLVKSNLEMGFKVAILSTFKSCFTVFQSDAWCLHSEEMLLNFHFWAHLCNCIPVRLSLVIRQKLLDNNYNSYLIKCSAVAGVMSMKAFVKIRIPNKGRWAHIKVKLLFLVPYYLVKQVRTMVWHYALKPWGFHMSHSCWKYFLRGFVSIRTGVSLRVYSTGTVHVEALGLRA